MDKNGRTSPGWDDIPTADPEIQKEYEAALGAFLVSFTQIENIVSDVMFPPWRKPKGRANS